MGERKRKEERGWRRREFMREREKGKRDRGREEENRSQGAGPGIHTSWLPAMTLSPYPQTTHAHTMHFTFTSFR